MISRQCLLVAITTILLFVAGSCNAAGRRSFGFNNINLSQERTININDFGAKGNGNDDTNAFEKAWKEVCSYEGSITLVVPKNSRYVVKPVRFEGPCKADRIRVQISGTIEASQDRSDFSDRHWLSFHRLQGLTVEGGGTLDGNGDVWWRNTCKVKKSQPCGTSAPTALTFNNCEQLVVRDLSVRNSPQMQMTFERCTNVSASNLRVTAPGNSPNTDGIHVTHTRNIHISDSVIGTGDDCISIVSGTQSVRATNITCGPGHGISIGSLGGGNSEAHVSDVTVDGAKFTGSTNGVRIKTWQGGSGDVSNVKFMNIEMHNVQNPIIIDQNYCLDRGGCPGQSSAVKIQDVLYRNISGTSATQVAVNLDCSETTKCRGIVLQDINIQYDGSHDRRRHHGHDDDDDDRDSVTGSRASCRNVDFTYVGHVAPDCPNSRSRSPSPPPPPPPPPPTQHPSPPPAHEQSPPPPPRPRQTPSPPTHHQSPPSHHHHHNHHRHQSPPPRNL